MTAGIHSYLPSERAEAATALLDAARTAVEEAALALQVRAPDDDAVALVDAVHGAQAEVGNWQRYIKKGCPRVRGTE